MSPKIILDLIEPTGSFQRRANSHCRVDIFHFLSADVSIVLGAEHLSESMDTRETNVHSERISNAETTLQFWRQADFARTFRRLKRDFTV